MGSAEDVTLRPNSADATGAICPWMLLTPGDSGIE